MKIIHLLSLFTILSFTISHAYVHDFCVADLKATETTSGYPCKPVAGITVNDFVYQGLIAGNVNNTSPVAFTGAFVDQFPGINGLGVSASVINIAEGHGVPIHTHPRGTELTLVSQGELTLGFFTPTNVYYKALKAGDAMVIPQGALHFAFNSGKGVTSAFVAFSSTNPGIHLTPNLLFGNNFPSDLVARTTLLDLAQIKKLKARFGGSG